MIVTIRNDNSKIIEDTNFGFGTFILNINKIDTIKVIKL